MNALVFVCFQSFVPYTVLVASVTAKRIDDNLWSHLNTEKTLKNLISFSVSHFLVSLDMV